jgi:hypothetical protein
MLLEGQQWVKTRGKTVYASKCSPKHVFLTSIASESEPEVKGTVKMKKIKGLSDESL